MTVLPIVSEVSRALAVWVCMIADDPGKLCIVNKRTDYEIYQEIEIKVYGDVLVLQIYSQHHRVLFTFDVNILLV